jgi:hypothetical protein
MNNKYLLAITLIIIATLCRIYQPIYNFAPVVAIGLFSGYIFRQKNMAIIITLLASFVGDMLISYINKYPLFHNSFVFVYLSYILITLFGNKLNNSKLEWNKVAIFGISSSLVFFVITNFGVWLMDSIYTKNISGLIECFIAAIPFYKNSFISDLIYIPLIFGSYAILTQRKMLSIKL